MGSILSEAMCTVSTMSAVSSEAVGSVRAIRCESVGSIVSVDCAEAIVCHKCVGICAWGQTNSWSSMRTGVRTDEWHVLGEMFDVVAEELLTVG